MTVRKPTVRKVATPKQKAGQVKWQAAGVAARRAKAAITPQAPPRKAVAKVVRQSATIKAAIPTTTVYHFTAPDSAASIVKNGFQSNQNTSWVKHAVWFSSTKTKATANALEMGQLGLDLSVLKAEVPTHLLQADQYVGSVGGHNDTGVLTGKTRWLTASADALKGIKVQDVTPKRRFSVKTNEREWHEYELALSRDMKRKMFLLTGVTSISQMKPGTFTPYYKWLRKNKISGGGSDKNKADFLKQAGYVPFTAKAPTAQNGTVIKTKKRPNSALRKKVLANPNWVNSKDAFSDVTIKAILKQLGK